MADDPANRFRENVTEITATVLTGIWLVGLFTGQWWWLPLLLVSYVVIVPLVALLFGDESDRQEWWEWDDAEESESDDDHPSTESEPHAAENNADALETLRERYAAGELTDDQFERKLERLLETETLEDVERWRRGAREERDRRRDRDRDVDTNLEFET
ncbi:SHOCT domain-containing protein [Natrarchaeobius oligotrophus]|uniref:SHOCT domain-containing protein n=1 Tax=Natrarchaeobius chitinivorans TaxID=1679083 RepID=A0A3N6PQ61_NATCH|nr:SHOCT domain-containing protein [Natrarchaeobius chitinivorans]RQH01376.1 SHOCT domain-containing protein [Natrarchaeobius chitinivorans]